MPLSSTRGFARTAAMFVLLALALPAAESARAQGTGAAAKPATVPAPKLKPQTGAPAAPTTLDAEMRMRANAWTVGIAAGQLEGAPIRFAAEIARAVDDEANLHVLPIVTRGPSENVNSLLYLKGVDAAIINTDVLEAFREKIPNVEKRITYLLSLFPSELHVFVRPEIKSLQDLAGKKVNFNTQGTAAAYSGPLIFERLGIAVDKTFIPHPTALEQMRSGEMAAVVFITSKPVEPFLRGRWDAGFKFLDVDYDDRFADYYLPATLQPQDYPALIKEGQQVKTIAVPTVLVAFNWARNSERYRRVARMTQNLFDRFATLQGPGYHPKWQEVNLAATVPGLQRFAAAQEWLDSARASTTGATTRTDNGIDLELVRAQVLRAAPTDSVEQERLFKEFLEWRKTRK
jgi:TRAP-type uncharacterized transport system substrate-binding protein